MEVFPTTDQIMAQDSSIVTRMKVYTVVEVAVEKVFLKTFVIFYNDNTLYMFVFN